jgi:hypothetical protein
MSWSAHLVKGLRLLGERWTTGPRKWISAGENWLDTSVRAGMVGGVGYIAWRLLASSWTVLAVAALVVCVLALRAATKAAKGQQQKAPSAVPVAADEALPNVTKDQFVTLAHELIAGAPGVHLTTLAAALSDRYGGDWDTADVRALCGAYSIPVQPSVRDARKRVSTGVHGADLPPLPQPLPGAPAAGDVAVVAAGHPATTGPTTPPTTPAPTTPTTPTVTTHGGVRVIARDDPDNPARTHVTVIDKTRKQAS